MKSRNNMAVLLLLTLVTAIAFVTPASADSYITGTVVEKYSEDPISGANVTATNGIDVFYDISSSSGFYLITIPTANIPGDYIVEATMLGYYGTALAPLNISGEGSSVAQNIVLTKAQYPETKSDTADPASIPADKGTSATVITATIEDQDGNLVANGFVETGIIANVSFYLRNGTLDVTTGFNGSLDNTSGGILVDPYTVINVPIDEFGEAKVTVYSGYVAGNVEVFNNVSVNNLAGEEVNATISVFFTPLQGHITGTVRSSEGARLADAEVSAYRLLWIHNTTTPEWTKIWEPVKTSITDDIGDYVIPFIPLKYDYTDGDKHYYYYYDIETVYDSVFTDEAPPFIHPPNNDSFGEPLTNIILVTASKDPYNNGSAYDFVSVDKTQTLDIILTSGQADELLVQIDGTEHQLASDASQNSDHTVTAKLLKDSNPFAVEKEDVTFTMSDTSLARFVVNGLVTTDVSIVVKTDVSGVATAIIRTSSANTGIVTVTGQHTTRDNVDLTDWDALNVQSSGEISGSVTNENNINIEAATVKLTGYNITSGEYDIYPVQDILGNNLVDRQSNSIGFYTFTNVPTGQYKVEAIYFSKSGFAAPVNVTSGTKTANIVVVGALGSVSGTVTSNGAPVAGADIFLGTNTVKSATTDANGNYIIINLVPGDTTLTAKKSGYNDATVDVTIISGDTTTANIAMTPTGGAGNQPPVIASLSPLSVNQYETVQLTVTASDPEGQQLFYAWDLDNDGVFEIGRSTSNARYHTFTTSGLNTIRVHVDDGVVSTEQVFTINVATVTIPAGNNNDPVISSISPVVVTLGNPTVLTATAADADAGTTLNYAWDLDGDGNFESGRSTGNTIMATLSSTKVITVRVDDGTRVTTQSLTIAASPTGGNAMPTFTGATPTTATVNVLTTFTLSATDGDSFPNPISYMVDANNDGTYDKVFVGNQDAIRSSINQVSITFTTTGTHVVPVRVDDGVATTLSSFTVVVS